MRVKGHAGPVRFSVSSDGRPPLLTSTSRMGQKAFSGRKGFSISFFAERASILPFFKKKLTIYPFLKKILQHQILVTLSPISHNETHKWTKKASRIIGKTCKAQKTCKSGTFRKNTLWIFINTLRNDHLSLHIHFQAFKPSYIFSSI